MAALQTALEILQDPKVIETVEEIMEETARLSATGNGFTLSLYPAMAAATFFGILGLYPLFSKMQT